MQSHGGSGTTYAIGRGIASSAIDGLQRVAGVPRVRDLHQSGEIRREIILLGQLKQDDAIYDKLSYDDESGYWVQQRAPNGMPYARSRRWKRCVASRYSTRSSRLSQRTRRRVRASRCS